MDFIYNKTAAGYNHIKNGIVCQDYSEAYIDNKYKIITACDGHGGKLYIRSDRGAKLASQAIIEVIKKYSVKKLENLILKKALHKLKLEILCKWNEFIDKDYSNNHFTNEELIYLSNDEIFKLNSNYITAYGTTLNAAILTKNHLICIQIGDGGMFYLKNKKMELVFPENDENVANVTNSLCSDSAYLNLYIKAVSKNKYNGIIICTDGLLAPYQTYNNFYLNFITPFINNFKIITKKKIDDLEQFIDNLATKLGVGDDISFSSILYER